MGTLAPRRLDCDRLQRLDALVRADALPTLGVAAMTLPADHPLRVDPTTPAGALLGRVPVLRVDASSRPDVVELAALLRGARPRRTSRLWWLTSGARTDGTAPTGRVIIAASVLGRPRVRFRVQLPLPLGLPALRLLARAGVVLIDPSDPDTPPSPTRPTIALAPAVDARTALRVLEEWST